VYCRRQNSFVSSTPAPVRPAASSSSRPLAAVDESPTAMTGAAEEQADLDAFDTARGLNVVALDECRVQNALPSSRPVSSAINSASPTPTVQ
jgi:hypothetical protein